MADLEDIDLLSTVYGIILRQFSFKVCKSIPNVAVLFFSFVFF